MNNEARKQIFIDTMTARGVTELEAAGVWDILCDDHKLTPKKSAIRYCELKGIKAKPLKFIDLIDDEGRTSYFSLDGNAAKDGFLNIGGGLAHGANIQPKTKADAEALIQFLTDFLND